MSFAPIIHALALPPETRVEQRVPKKLLVENGAPTAGDKKQINDGIEEILWHAALKPANLSFEEAAAMPMASVTALQGLRDIGRIKAGQKVLIHGASGGVGTFAVQIAKSFGAEVTAVCSTSKVEQARSLGADHVVDYTREDFAQSTQPYDLIFTANGNRQLADFERVLTPTGTYVLSGGAFSKLFQAILLGSFRSKAGGKSIKTFVAKPNQADLNTMKELVESGMVKPVIDKRYSLRETPAAMRNLEEGHAGGKIVVTI